MSGYTPDRIWLISEQPHDDAAEILRSSGAAVTVTASGDPPRDTSCAQVAVIATSKTGRGLMEWVGRVCAAFPSRASIVISADAGIHDVRALLRAGVRGVVLREHMSRTLLVAVAAVASGQVCLPSDEVIAPRRPVLSMREKQVVGLVARGLMNAQIADRLFLAESTVKSHLSSAFAKLGVNSRHEAVELLMNRASGLGPGILSLEEARAVGSEVTDPD